MLDSFLGWITEQLDYYGLGKIIGGVVALIAAAGAVSTVVGSAVIVDAVAASAVFLVLVFLVAVIREHKRLRALASTAHTLLQRYCDIVENLSDVELDVDTWEQLVELDKRGNARVIRKITLTPKRASLHFLRLSLKYYGSSEQTLRLRHKVKATARELSGARWESSWFWKDNRTHEVIVHFRNEIEEGRPISVEVEWRWPLFSAELMSGGYEDFDIRFTHRVARASHMVTLPVIENSRLPSISPNGTRPEIKREGGTCRISFNVDPCYQRTRYGVRIDRSGSPVAR